MKRRQTHINKNISKTRRSTRDGAQKRVELTREKGAKKRLEEKNKGENSENRSASEQTSGADRARKIKKLTMSEQKIVNKTSNRRKSIITIAQFSNIK